MGLILFVLSLSVLRLIVLSLIVASASLAQVVSPVEIKDPALRTLQQQYMDDLSRAGEDILANHFDYPFYLSRKLDLDQAQQQIADQSSIRFDTYNGKTVLAITGNYYAAYSAQKISPGQRARSTFLKVVMPILKAAVPRFQNNQHVQGFAVEISHHIMGKVMGVSMERPENLMVFLPRNGALKLLVAKDETAQQAALLQGEVFLNAQNPSQFGLTMRYPRRLLMLIPMTTPMTLPPTPNRIQLKREPKSFRRETATDRRQAPPLLR